MANLVTAAAKLFDHIAVGIDFSEASDTALAHAVELAKRTGAELTLIHVYTPTLAVLAGPGARYFQTSLRDHLGVAHELLNARKNIAEEAGVTTATQLIAGDPKRGVAAEAKVVGASLLVVGSHGRTGIRRFLMGSVAELAVRLSEIDVLVARETRPAYERVLVPVDYSEQSEQAVDMAVQLVAPRGAIDLLHAVEPPASIALADSMGLAITSLKHEAEKRGAALLDRYRASYPEMSLTTISDSATHAIRQRLDDQHYDLVILGSHGRSGIARWVLGSVAETTVRHAPNSVMVIKQPTE